MIHRNTRQQEQEYKDKLKEAHKTFRQKRVLFKSMVEDMEIAYNNNETKTLYQEVNINRKMVQTTNILFRDKEDNVVSNKEKAMQRPSEYYEKHFELQDGMDKDSGECAYKLQNYILNDQMLQTQG
jgi:Zn-dependent M16 (insulinase) family peptidase